MMTSLRALRPWQILSVMAANLPGLFRSTHSALADISTPGQAQQIDSKVAGTSSEWSGPAKTPARKPPSKPDRSGNFCFDPINTVRPQSDELCVLYGSPKNGLEEAEVCRTMRNTEDNRVKLCHNSGRGERRQRGQGAEVARETVASTIMVHNANLQRL
jgi:hypothetical protein